MASIGKMLAQVCFRPIMSIRVLPICPPSLTLSPQATVSEVMSMMIQREINHIALCEADGRFAGLISSNAILRALIPLSARVDHGVEHLDFLGDALPMLVNHLRDHADKPAALLVDVDVKALSQETSLLLAANQLSQATAPLPVLDEQGRLLGMLSRRMLLTWLLEKSKTH